MSRYDNKQKDSQKTWLFLGGALLLLLSLAIIKLLMSDDEEKPLMSAVQATTPAKTTNLNDASGAMEYIYNAPESENDIRYGYQWEILRTALERTIPSYGPYSMKKSAFMPEKRQLFELENNTQALTVMYLSTTRDMEKKLLPVRIPVDKNLGGYCIMLIRKEDQDRFSKIRTLEQLEKTPIGLGNGWIDVDILRFNHFNIVTGSDYEGLFRMLANKRFDAFSRSAVEILDEYSSRQKQLPDLKIEDSLLLYYPLPMYFWFAKTEQGKRLAERAREGMEGMLRDGTYDSIFNYYQGYKTEKLHLKKRRLLKVENPFLSEETPFDDKRLWYDPIN
ncbi:MAG: substrate-binding periplasmic protein [Bacteroidia bacterium]